MSRVLDATFGSDHATCIVGVGVGVDAEPNASVRSDVEDRRATHSIVRSLIRTGVPIGHAVANVSIPAIGDSGWPGLWDAR
jgi:hypothetical protein